MQKKAFNSTLIKKSDIGETLQNEPKQGKNILEPIKTLARERAISYNILEDTNVTNDAEVHLHEADLWNCLQGEVEFTLGGELKNGMHRKDANGNENPNELFAKEIIGGEKITLTAGDWLWIPAGEPHQHSAKGTARLVIVKIPKGK